MSSTELNVFKDEVLNEIREMEKKFLNELSKKNFDIQLIMKHLVKK
jgi:hypothetical protein